MQDILLEPYGGKILHLPVGATTALTAMLALGGGARSDPRRAEARPRSGRRTASPGSARCVGIVAFCCVHLRGAAGICSTLFGFGVAMIGFGGGLFAHGTLTASMDARAAGRPRPRARRLGRRAGDRRGPRHRRQRRRQRPRLVARDARRSRRCARQSRNRLHVRLRDRNRSSLRHAHRRSDRLCGHATASVRHDREDSACRSRPVSTREACDDTRRSTAISTSPRSCSTRSGCSSPV